MSFHHSCKVCLCFAKQASLQLPFFKRGLLDYNIPPFPLPVANSVSVGEGGKVMPASIRPTVIFLLDLFIYSSRACDATKAQEKEQPQKEEISLV